VRVNEEGDHCDSLDELDRSHRISNRSQEDGVPREPDRAESLEDAETSGHERDDRGCRNTDSLDARYRNTLELDMGSLRGRDQCCVGGSLQFNIHRQCPTSDGNIVPHTISLIFTSKVAGNLLRIFAIKENISQVFYTFVFLFIRRFYSVEVQQRFFTAFLKVFSRGGSEGLPYPTDCF
jgi:hypothetical protein